MAFRVRLHFPDGTVEEDDEVAETEDEANEYGLYLISSYSAGA